MTMTTREMEIVETVNGLLRMISDKVVGLAERRATDDLLHIRARLVELAAGYNAFETEEMTNARTIRIAAGYYTVSGKDGKRVRVCIPND